MRPRRIAALLCLLLAGAARAAEPAPPRAVVCELLVNGFMSGGAAWVDDTHVLTCAHPIRTPDAKLGIVAGLTNRLDAALVAVDLAHDLALLRVENAPPHPVATLAEANPAEAEALFVLGPALRNPPLRLPGTAAHPTPLLAEWETTSGYLQPLLVAAHTPHLSSGGPWFNARGEMVGVQNGYLNNDKGEASGIALVAPTTALRRLRDTKVDAATPDLGFWAWELWTASAEHIAFFPEKQPGLILTRIFEHGPLVKKVDRLDLLLAVNGATMIRRHDLLAVLNVVKPGDTVTLRVMRKKTHAIEEIPMVAGGVEARWRAKK